MSTQTNDPLRYRFRKYYKPKSLTWWASFVPLCAGLFMALAPVHGLTGWAASVGNAFGSADPALLINAGLLGIGLRGAVA